MYTGTVWGITLVILGVLLSLGAVQLLAAVVQPGMVGAAARNAAQRPWRSGLVGVLPAGLIVLALNLLGSGGPGLKLGAFLLLCALAVLLACGLGGLSLAVGRRLPRASGDEMAWRTLLRGAVTTELSWLVPFVGWLFVLPVSAAVALGAALIAVFQRRLRAEAAADLAAPAAPAAVEPPTVPGAA